MLKSRKVLVCQETPCLSMGSDIIYEEFKKEVARQGLYNAAVELSGCHGHGLCSQGLSVVVEPDGVFYSNVQVEDVPEIVSSHLRDSIPVERLSIMIR